MNSRGSCSFTTDWSGGHSILDWLLPAFPSLHGSFLPPSFSPLNPSFFVLSLPLSFFHIPLLPSSCPSFFSSLLSSISLYLPKFYFLLLISFLLNSSPSSPFFPSALHPFPLSHLSFLMALFFPLPSITAFFPSLPTCSLCLHPGLLSSSFTLSSFSSSSFTPLQDDGQTTGGGGEAWGAEVQPGQTVLLLHPVQC